MIHELTKEQLEMVEYSDLYGYKQTCEKFSIKKYQLYYLKNKRKRLKEQNKIEGSTFIKVPIDAVIKKEDKLKDEEISFSISNTKIKMKLSDFKKVFVND